MWTVTPWGIVSLSICSCHSWHLRYSWKYKVRATEISFNVLLLPFIVLYFCSILTFLHFLLSSFLSFSLFFFLLFSRVTTQKHLSRYLLWFSLFIYFFYTSCFLFLFFPLLLPSYAFLLISYSLASLRATISHSGFRYFFLLIFSVIIIFLIILLLSIWSFLLFFIPFFLPIETECALYYRAQQQWGDGRWNGLLEEFEA
jgi:hypothetical protein